MQAYTDRQIEWRYSNNEMDFKNHVINTFSVNIFGQNYAFFRKV
jgi:hypothetical protein